MFQAALRNLSRKDESVTQHFRFAAEVPRDRHTELEDANWVDGLKEDAQTWLTKARASKMVTKCAQSHMMRRERGYKQVKSEPTYMNHEWLAR